MNAIEKLLFLLVCVIAVAGGIGLYFYIFSPGLFVTIIETASTQLQQLPTLAGKAYETFTTNPAILISSIGGLATFGGLAYKAYSNVKARKQEAEQLLSSSSSVLEQKEGQIAELQNKITQLEKPDTVIGALQSELAETQQTISSQAQTIQTLRAQLSDINHNLSTIQSPSEEEMVRRLIASKKYNVSPKVA